MEDVTKGADSRLSPSGSLPGLLVISTRHLRGVSSGLKSTSTAINRGAVGVSSGQSASLGAVISLARAQARLRCHVVMRGMAVAAGQKTMNWKALGLSTWAKNSEIGVESTIPHIISTFSYILEEASS